MKRWRGWKRQRRKSEKGNHRSLEIMDQSRKAEKSEFENLRLWTWATEGKVTITVACMIWRLRSSGDEAGKVRKNFFPLLLFILMFSLSKLAVFGFVLSDFLKLFDHSRPIQKHHYQSTIPDKFSPESLIDHIRFIIIILLLKLQMNCKVFQLKWCG